MDTFQVNPKAIGADMAVHHPHDMQAFYRMCGEGELVGGVHTLSGGVVQVYHRLQVQEEEEKGRKVEQEIERENQGEENAQMTMHMEMR